jgi:glucosylglycerate synthase
LLILGVEISVAEETFLTDDLVQQLISVGEVDILVGIPSRNNAETIGRVVESVEESFQRAFARERAVIVNIDAGSNDGTPDLFLSSKLRKNGGAHGLTSLRTEHRVTARYDTASQAAVFRAIVATADLLRAKACAVLSPATPNLTADWVGNLLQPVYRQNFDFVAPLYSRQRFDGLLARILLYPVSRAIFGKRIRELFSSELAFSGRIATHCLNQDVWHEATIQDLPQAWLALSAISGDFRCCQSFMGPKIRATVPGIDLVTAIRQAVGALFWFVESQQSAWMNRTESEPVTTFGADHELTDDQSTINLPRLFELFRSGVAELSPILKTLLAADTFAEIQRLSTLDERNLCYENSLWAKTLYDFAASYHHSLLNRDHLIQALVPLYRGKLYSFFLQHASSSPAEIEADSEQLCLELERQKPYLVERWKARTEVTA